MTGIFDYSRAVYFAPNSAVNRLYIRVKSRVNITWPGKTREYWLAAQHPRENTFQDDGHIYDTMIANDGNGASFITFLFDQAAGEAIISRRYDNPGQPEIYKHQLSGTYAGPLVAPPQNIPASELRELLNFTDVLAAATAGDPMFAVIEYSFNPTNTVRIEAPIEVLNINPLTKTQAVQEGKEWQIVTEQIPIYVPSAGSDDIMRTRVGYAAFSRVGPSVQVCFVYIGNLSSPRETQDYALTQNYNCSTKLYARAA